MMFFHVTVGFDNCGPEIVLIEAKNAHQARQFAQARYPGGHIGGANLVNGNGQL